MKARTRALIVTAATTAALALLPTPHALAGFKFP
jgi:hypothetical protein